MSRESLVYCSAWEGVPAAPEVKMRVVELEDMVRVRVGVFGMVMAVVERREGRRNALSIYLDNLGEYRGLSYGMLVSQRESRLVLKKMEMHVTGDVAVIVR